MIKISDLDKVLLIAELQDQLNNPVKSMVNSELAYVYDRLKLQDQNLARTFWHSVTLGNSFMIDDQDVRALITRLQEIDQLAMSAMPEWGSYGT
jgi:hypothetical protein